MEHPLSLYLADACAPIDFYTADPDFPIDLRRLIEEETPSIAVAATTVWEIGIKLQRGKLMDLCPPDFPTLSDMLQAHAFDLLPVDHATAEQAARLPPFHQDPFDRALVAIAQRTGRAALTSDR